MAKNYASAVERIEPASNNKKVALIVAIVLVVVVIGVYLLVFSPRVSASASSSVSIVDVQDTSASYASSAPPVEPSEEIDQPQPSVVSEKTYSFDEIDRMVAALEPKVSEKLRAQFELEPAYWEVGVDGGVSIVGDYISTANVYEEKFSEPVDDFEVDYGQGEFRAVFDISNRVIQLEVAHIVLVKDGLESVVEPWGDELTQNELFIIDTVLEELGIASYDYKWTTKSYTEAKDGSVSLSARLEILSTGEVRDVVAEIDAMGVIEDIRF